MNFYSCVWHVLSLSPVPKPNGIFNAEFCHGSASCFPTGFSSQCVVYVLEDEPSVVFHAVVFHNKAFPFTCSWVLHMTCPGTISNWGVFNLSCIKHLTHG